MRNRDSTDVLGDLVLQLTHALRRTGIHQSGHPQAETAFPALFALLSTVTAEGHPLTLLSRPPQAPPGGKGEEGEILVEAAGEQARRLREVMARGVADTCSQGLSPLMERLGLASAAFLPGMAKEELAALVGLLADAPPVETGDREAPARLAAALRQRGISRFSFLLRQELLDSARDIPWRVRVALSLLRRDLSLAPLLPPEEARRARRQTIAEAMRPLETEPLAYPFLMNIDLAAPPGLPAEEGENEVLSLLEEDVLLALVPALLDDAAGRRPRYRDVIPPDRFDRLTGKIVFRLGQLRRPEADGLLEGMFDAGLVAMESLPPPVQERIITTRLAGDFLDHSQAILAALSSAPDPDSYRTRARPSTRVVPFLLGKGHHREAAALAELFGVHARGEDERGKAAREAVGWMIEGGTMEEALRIFLLSESKEERAAAGRVLAVFGGRAVPYLARVLRESEDPWKIKQAGEILAAGGGESTLALIEALEDPSLPAPASATLFRVLGSLDDDDLAPLASRAALARLGDPHDEVRRMALRTLCLLDPQGPPPGHYELFLRALRDPFPPARLEAIRGLGLCGDPRALQHLRDLVSRGERRGPRGGGGEEWETAAQALDALGHAHTALAGEREAILSFLLEAGERLYPKPSLKTLTRTLAGGSRAPSLALQGLAHALARTGSPRARPLLERMASDRDPALSARAAQLLRQHKGL